MRDLRCFDMKCYVIRKGGAFRHTTHTESYDRERKKERVERKRTVWCMRYMRIKVAGSRVIASYDSEECEEKTEREIVKDG